MAGGLTFDERFVVETLESGRHQAVRRTPGGGVVARGTEYEDPLDARCELLLLRTWAVITRTDPGPDNYGPVTDSGQVRTAAGLRRQDMTVVLEDGTELPVVLSIGTVSKLPSLSPDEPLAVVVGPTAGGSYLNFKFDLAAPVQ